MPQPAPLLIVGDRNTVANCCENDRSTAQRKTFFGRLYFPIVVSNRSYVLVKATELETHVVELETRLAFQEHTLQALNDVVTRQQQQIEALVRETQALKDRLRAAAASPVGLLGDEKPPPHY